MGKAEGISHVGLVDELGTTGVSDVRQSVLLLRKKKQNAACVLCYSHDRDGENKTQRAFWFIICCCKEGEVTEKKKTYICVF